ncbi:MAG TPA: TIM barrel protein [Roseiflexaceae bacterium]|nr:TIM barrel protein [Roseiflexaceae bacterium]
MQLLLARHLWGVDEAWEQAFPRFYAQGYRAIETGLPAAEDRDRFRALLDHYGFAYIAQIFTAGSTVAQHLESFRAQIASAASLQPMLINSHSGRDSWSADACRQFFAEALAIEAEYGISVAHETHRGRILYTPWVTAELLNEFADLKLCCDYSHWVCVAERLLDDQQAIFEQCAERCVHLHARVGYEEGPQVPDPRAPEYQRYLEAHEVWWRAIWQAQRARGLQQTTLTPEFGPPGYLHTLPYTRQPVADLAEICNWQATRQAEQFVRWQAESTR